MYLCFFNVIKKNVCYMYDEEYIVSKVFLEYISVNIYSVFCNYFCL